MEITTKGRNAVRIMADIARHNDVFVSLSDIVTRQRISIKYAEKIIAMLVKSGCLISMRGKNGGYKLSREAKDISVNQILIATGDEVKLDTCSRKNCARAGQCENMGVWNTLASLIDNYLDGVTLQDLIDKTYHKIKFN